MLIKRTSPSMRKFHCTNYYTRLRKRGANRVDCNHFDTQTTTAQPPSPSQCRSFLDPYAPVSKTGSA
ncbi:hypothetical protein IAQ61_005106 [Plenodomus lingam]|uniref:uncharacterized protein n=1 Tax=Leptosphaeria maculans TaxID=5022 RepID=UPI003326321A|nr:hypothetical protein IAQ61_005106 [Plenodomus lingam]